MKEDKKQQVAKSIVAATKMEDRETIRLWLSSLIHIQSSNEPIQTKFRKAIQATSKSGVTGVVVKSIARETRRLGWQERSNTARIGLTAAAAGLILTGGQGAGIAALGTAIGVPLWFVTGAGAMFLKVLYDEFTQEQRGIRAQQNEQRRHSP